jgi:AcrR family transcriptional regulator
VNSRKSRPAHELKALPPQRQRGKDRVAELMEAATAVIAAKGFEAATMAEIAQRAGAQIGSLYRFFPNKEVLADALIQRYGELIAAVFDEIDSRAAHCSIYELSDSLMSVLVNLHGEIQAIIALLDAHSDRSEKRTEFRRAFHKRIAHALRLRSPPLSAAMAKDMAIVLLENMRTMAALKSAKAKDVHPGAITELSNMTYLYLEYRLGVSAAGRDAVGPTRRTVRSGTKTATRKR